MFVTCRILKKLKVKLKPRPELTTREIIFSIFCNFVDVYTWISAEMHVSDDAGVDELRLKSLLITPPSSFHPSLQMPILKFLD